MTTEQRAEAQQRSRAADKSRYGIGNFKLYAQRLRRVGTTLNLEQALVATGLNTEQGRQRALRQMHEVGLVRIDGDVVTVKVVEPTGRHRGPGVKASVNGHRYNSERPGYRSDTRNGPVRTYMGHDVPKAVRELTDDEVAERLGREFEVAMIEDDSEVIETGIRVAALPDDEGYD